MAFLFSEPQQLSCPACRQHTLPRLPSLQPDERGEVPYRLTSVSCHACRAVVTLDVSGGRPVSDGGTDWKDICETCGDKVELRDEMATMPMHGAIPNPGRPPVPLFRMAWCPTCDEQRVVFPKVVKFRSVNGNWVEFRSTRCPGCRNNTLGYKVPAPTEYRRRETLRGQLGFPISLSARAMGCCGRCKTLKWFEIYEGDEKPAADWGGRLLNWFRRQVRRRAT